jgi:hypothetical protein
LPAYFSQTCVSLAGTCVNSRRCLRRVIPRSIAEVDCGCNLNAELDCPEASRPALFHHLVLPPISSEVVSSDLGSFWLVWMTPPQRGYSFWGTSSSPCPLGVCSVCSVFSVCASAWGKVGSCAPSWLSSIRCNTALCKSGCHCWRQELFFLSYQLRGNCLAI